MKIVARDYSLILAQHAEAQQQQATTNCPSPLQAGDRCSEISVKGFEMRHLISMLQARSCEVRDRPFNSQAPYAEVQR